MIFPSEKKTSINMINVRFVIFIVLFCGLILSSSLDARASCIAYGWTKAMGDTSTSNDDSVWDVVTDSSGHIFLTGGFQGTVDFDPSASTDTKTSNGGTDIFVTKIRSNGAYGWTKTIGSDQDDLAQGIDVDSSGNVFITGSFQRNSSSPLYVDFDPSAGTDNHTARAGGSDIFLTKFTNSGGYGWTRSYDGGGATHVAVDSNDDIYITGQWNEQSADFDPTSGVDTHTNTDTNPTGPWTYDIFFSKMNANNTYGFTYTWGSTTNDTGQGIAFDSSDRRYIVGSFTGTNVDMDPTTGTDLHSSNGSRDIFITRINAANGYGWTKTIGSSSGDDWAERVTLDSNNRIFFTGGFRGTNTDFNPGTGTANLTSAGGTDAFLARFTTAGVYGSAYRMGGTTDDAGYDVAIDGNDNIHVNGTFTGSSADLDPSSGVENFASNGGRDAFITMMNGSNLSYRYTYTIGGTGNESSLGVDTDWKRATGNTNAVYSGITFRNSNVDFDPTSGTDNYSSQGGSDIALMQLLDGYPYADIGFKYRDSGVTNTIAAECGTVVSPLRIRDSGTTYGIDLVTLLTADYASDIRVRTSGTTKAARICQNNCTTSP